MSKRPVPIQSDLSRVSSGRRIRWTRPVAMLAAGAAALAGMVLAQGLTAAQKAAADTQIASPERSRASLWSLSQGTWEVFANRGDPALADSPDEWGGYAVMVYLADASGTGLPVDATPPLSVAAAANDPYGGAGLEFSNGGTFECTSADLASDVCDAGWFSLDVYSYKSGIRKLEVTYGESGGDQFKVPAAEAWVTTILDARFTATFSDEWSTLVVSPSNPQDDPDALTGFPVGIPETVTVGTAYEVIYTAWDAGRNNRIVEDFATWTYLVGEDEEEECPAMFQNGTSYGPDMMTPDPNGRITMRIVSYEPTTCILLFGAGEEGRTLRWVDQPLDVSSPKTWYSVTVDGVVAGGGDQGGIDVQLMGQDGAPVVMAADLIEASVDPTSGISIGAFEHVGAGHYEASFSGTTPGSFPVAVTVDGQAIGIQPGVGNGTAWIVGPGLPPAVDRSSVTVTRLEDQMANHDAPGSTIAEWGRQTIRATLKDRDGEPVTSGAGSVVAAAAPGDLLDGIGLYFGNGGLFACAEAPVDGVCQNGEYVLPVYSSKAGERQITVTYRPGETDQVVLVNADRPTSGVLRAEFVTPPLSRAYSTVTITPSAPVDNPDDPLDEPDGEALTLDLNSPLQRYQVTVTLWDEGRHNRVGGEEVHLQVLGSLQGGDFCYAGFDGSFASAAGAYFSVPPSGRVVTEVFMREPRNGACDLFAFTERGPTAGPIGGSPKALRWEYTEPDLSVRGGGSFFEVWSSPVPADGVSMGGIAVALDGGGDDEEGVIWGQADKLSLIAPEDSGIELRRVWQEVEGMYYMDFTGTVPGDFDLMVTYDGRPMVPAGEGRPNPIYATAHMVAAEEPPVSSTLTRSRIKIDELDPDETPRAGPQPAAREYSDSLHGVPALLAVDMKYIDGTPAEGWESSALTWRAAPDDPHDGEGLFDLKGGGFEWWDGSASEAYLPLYSTLPGPRSVIISYGGRDIHFDVPTEEDPNSTVLTVDYGPPAPLASASTMVVTPSVTVGLQDDPNDPAGETNDIAAPLAPGQTYELVITGWDAGRTNRAGGSYVNVALQSFGDTYCEAYFVDPDEPDARADSVSVDLDSAGRAVLHVRADEAAICSVWANVDMRDFAGSPKTLRWIGTNIDVTDPDTWYDVSPEPVTAGGIDHGTVTIQARDLDGQPVVDAAGSLTARAASDAGISVTQFSHLGGGVYQAQFTGAYEGDFAISAFIGDDWFQVREDGNLTAHIVAQSAPRGVPYMPASWLIQPEGTAAANGVSELVVGAQINDAYGEGVGNVDVFFELPALVCPAAGPCLPDLPGPMVAQAKTNSDGLAQLTLVSPYLREVPDSGIRVAASVANQAVTRVRTAAEPDADLADQSGFMLLGFEPRVITSGPELSRVIAPDLPTSLPQNHLYSPVTVYLADQDGVPFEGVEESSAVGLDVRFEPEAAGTGGMWWDHLLESGYSADFWFVSPDMPARVSIVGAEATVRLSFGDLTHELEGTITQGVPLEIEFYEVPQPAVLHPDLSTVVVTTADEPREVGESHTVVATLRDEDNDLWTSQETVMFLYRAPGSDTWSTSPNVATTNGEATWELVGEVEGVYEVKAWVRPEQWIEIAHVAEAEFVDSSPPRGVPDLTKSWLIEPYGTVTANGQRALVLAARIHDAYGEPVGGEDVQFFIPEFVSSGLVDGPATLTATTDGSGFAQIVVVSPFIGTTPPEGLVATATVDGSQLSRVKEFGEPDEDIPGRDGHAVLSFEQRRVTSGWSMSRLTGPQQDRPAYTSEETLTVEARVTDQEGEPFTDSAVTFKSPNRDLVIGDESNPYESTVPVGADGIARIEVGSRLPGFFEVTATGSAVLRYKEYPAITVSDEITFGSPVVLEFGTVVCNCLESTLQVVTANQDRYVGEAHQVRVELFNQYGDHYDPPEGVQFAYRAPGSPNWVNAEAPVMTTSGVAYWMLTGAEPGEYWVSATVDDSLVGNPQPAEFRPRPPNPPVLDLEQSVFSVTPADQTREVGQSFLLTANLLSDQGVEWTQPEPVVFSYRASGESGWSQLATQPTLDGDAEWEWTGDAVGSFELSASVRGELFGGIKTVEFVPASLDFDAIRASFESTEGDPRDPHSEVHEASLTVWNVLQEPVHEEQVTFELVSITGDVFFINESGVGVEDHQLTVRTSAGGGAGVTVGASGDGSAWLVVSVGGVEIDRAEFRFATPPVVPVLDLESSTFQVTTGANTVYAGGFHTLRVDLVDQSGGAWREPETVLFSYQAPGSGVWIGLPPETTGNLGWATADLIGMVPGDYKVRAEVRAEPVGQELVARFHEPDPEPPVFDPRQSSFVVATADERKYVGQSHTLEARLKDQHGNPWATEVVFSYQAPGETTWTEARAVSDAEWGVATVDVTGTVAGSYLVRAEVGDVQVGGELTASFLAAPMLSRDRSSFVVSTAGDPRFVGQVHVLEATLKDQYGDPWVDSVVFSYRTPDEPGWVTVPTEPTDGEGVARWGLTGLVAGHYVVRAEVGAEQIGTLRTATFTVPPLDLDRIRASFEATDGPRDPRSQVHGASVVVWDVLNTVVNGQDVVFELFPVNGDLFFLDEAGGRAPNPLTVGSSAAGVAAVRVGGVGDG
ncbi:MAG: hypothetical protein LBH68_06330, partial [Bifidobacteriaceae bacterium]|nr:hypothetical protein [Bifidobacteriaceae bacterium]